MHTCVIDWGNTLIKLGHFEAGQLVNSWVSPDIEEIEEKLFKIPAKRGMLSSVTQVSEAFVKKMQKHGISIKTLTPEATLPFNNHYESKTTLGKDRIAAVAGAVSLYPDQASLVIDMGTCITYDYVDTGKNYLGGLISPGLKMRLRAMHEFTGRLPLVDYSMSIDGFEGKNTRQGMINGVLHGISAEVNGIIEAYRDKKGDFRVVLCGGDANRFEYSIKAPIFVAPKLLLFGLNAILELNET